MILLPLSLPSHSVCMTHTAVLTPPKSEVIPSAFISSANSQPLLTLQPHLCPGPVARSFCRRLIELPWGPGLGVVSFLCAVPHPVSSPFTPSCLPSSLFSSSFFFFQISYHEIHPFNVYKSTVFIISSQSCTSIPTINCRAFLFPQKMPCTH